MKKISFLMLLFFLPVTALAAATATTPADDRSATAVIETLNATLLKCMREGEKLGFRGRFALLEPVMRRSFFYEFMVRKSTGSAWKKLDPARREQLLERYITWSVGSYARRFSHFSGQRFTIIASEPLRGGRYMKVTSRITRPEKKPRDLTYILTKNNGRWMIVDIQVEGVSQLSMTRSQFRSVLKKEGIDGLLGILDEKIRRNASADS